MSARRVAVLGGTFNPIHNGHLALARGFARLLSLQEIVLMVTNVPPHKRTPALAPGEDRLAMCRLAAREEPLLTVSDLELTRPGKSYTCETLAVLKGRMPDAELFFITGADMFLTLEEWKNPAQIFALATVCAAPRGAETAAALRRYAARLQSRGARTVVADFVPPDVSSTQIRRLAAAGGKLDGLVPAAVERYIRRHGLYGAGAPREGGDSDGV